MVTYKCIYRYCMCHYKAWSCKNHQWMLNLGVGTFQDKQDICMVFFFFSSTTLLLQIHLPPPSCTHAQSCNPMDCSPPDSYVHGLFQARILEWVAISFSHMHGLKGFLCRMFISCKGRTTCVEIRQQLNQLIIINITTECQMNIVFL